MKEKRQQTLGELVEEFAWSTVAQRTAKDAKTGNKYAKRRIAAFEKLRAHGDAGRDALAVLLTHPRPEVRVMAATYLLRHKTVEAKAVLEQAAREQGPVAFGAEQALLRWSEGTWELDPPDEL